MNAITGELIWKVETYTREHYMDGDLNISTISRIFGISPSYFCSLFKKETGQTYAAFLIHLRLEKAAELLRKTDEKACEISLEVGYNQPYYFSRAFKQHYGVAPSVFRMGH